MIMMIMVVVVVMVVMEFRVVVSQKFMVKK